MPNGWEKALHPGAMDCLERLRGAGYEAYPVGGCVRDLLLGRRPGDVDVCTSALPQAVLDLFPQAVPTGLAHGTVTVVTPTGPVEVTTFRSEGGYTDGRHPDAVAFGATLAEDLSRRDFTVNAMALDPGGEVIDPFGGQEDLRKKLLRCVGDPDRRFAEDALRMLRGVRFAAQLGFDIEANTHAAMARNGHRSALLSGERVKAELEKTLLSPRPELAGEMVRLGLLSHLYAFPADFDLSGLSQVPAEQKARWRGFCAATGFPITALPVERALRRGVEHPEAELIPALALKPRDLMALGLEGPQISAAQKRLALHVLDHPEDNRAERLKEILAGHTGNDQ